MYVYTHACLKIYSKVVTDWRNFFFCTPTPIPRVRQRRALKEDQINDKDWNTNFACGSQASTLIGHLSLVCHQSRNISFVNDFIKKENSPPPLPCHILVYNVYEFNNGFTKQPINLRKLYLYLGIQKNKLLI